MNNDLKFSKESETKKPRREAGVWDNHTMLVSDHPVAPVRKWDVVVLRSLVPAHIGCFMQPFTPRHAVPLVISRVADSDGCNNAWAGDLTITAESARMVGWVREDMARSRGR